MTIPTQIYTEIAQETSQKINTKNK